MRLAVDGAVSRGERVPELDGCVGIHWVRRMYAGYEGEREVLVSRGHLAGLSCAAAVLCSGVAVAWRSVGVQCTGVRLASVVEKVEASKREEKKKGRWQEPREAGEVRSGQTG